MTKLRLCVLLDVTEPDDRDEVSRVVDTTGTEVILARPIRNVRTESGAATRLSIALCRLDGWVRSA